MDTKVALQMAMGTGEMVCMSYLKDLTDDELMQRPHAECNHINWQVGHLIAADNQMLNSCLPGSMPDLPEGFADKYSKETCKVDDASRFHTKDELLAIYEKQRAAAKAALEALPEADLAKPSPESMQAYAPNIAAVFNMLGAHWLMHCGQWVIVRRATGKPVVI